MVRLLPPERDIGVLNAPVRSCLALIGAFLLVLLALGLLERIGMRPGAALTGVIGAGGALFAFAALLSHSRRAVDFYVADRKVRGAFGGLVSAASFAGLIALGLSAGAFRSEADFLVAAAGLATGYLILALVIAPGLRGLGAYTPGDFLAARFGGLWARLAWALVAFSVSLLLLVAILNLAASLLTTIFAIASEHALYAAAGLMAVAALPGGMRSLSWVQAIQYFVIALAAVVTAGFLADADPAFDSALTNAASAFFSNLPSWSSVAGGQSMLPTLFMALGAAALPHHVTRVLTAEPGRGAAKAITSGVLFSAVLMALGIALAGFIIRSGADDPSLASFIGRIAGTSGTVAGLALAGILAALLALGQAVLFSAATALSHDVWDEMVDRRGPEGRRIVVARLMVIAVAALAVAVAPGWAAEPSALFEWALALAAAGGLAPITLGLWWRRCNEIGALGGIVAGFGFAVLAFVMNQNVIPVAVLASGWTEVGAPVAAITGMLASLVVAIGLSLVTPSPDAGARRLATGGAERSGAPPIRERPA